MVLLRTLWLTSPYQRTSNYEIKSKALRVGICYNSFNPPLLASVPFPNIVFDSFSYFYLNI